MKKVVVFVDALKPEEATGFLNETKQGKIKCHVPRVTPTILGSIYTGTTPDYHSLVRPTPLYQPAIQRPTGRTIMELLSTQARVLSYMMPFSMNLQLQNGLAVQSGVAGTIGQVPPALQIPRPPINMGDIDPEKALQSFIDHARIMFGTAREMIRMDSADIYFLSFRNIDSFTHWFYNGDYRKRLIEYISYELQDFTYMGDDVEIMWFSDHGGCPADEVFRANRWLIEKGYLKTTILERRHRQMMKQQEEQAKQQGGSMPYSDQIDPQAPFVQIDKDSKFIAVDAFDACIDALPDATEEDKKNLVADLESEGIFKAVYRKKDIYPANNNQVPEIIPDRKEGKLVSGNIYPDCPVYGFTDHKTVINSRDGDHSSYACFGSTNNVGSGQTILPEDLYYEIQKFCRNVTAKTEQPPQIHSDAPLPHLDV